MDVKEDDADGESGETRRGGASETTRPEETGETRRTCVVHDERVGSGNVNDKG